MLEATDCPETLEALYTRGYHRERRIVDAWGRPIDYRCRGTGDALTFHLCSAGPDGELDTADDILSTIVLDAMKSS